MTAPPWFPIEVGVVMSLVLPTHLDPSAFCGVLVTVATGLPTRWGPNVHAAASVSGILCVGLVGLFASIVLSYVCRRRGSTVSVFLLVPHVDCLSLVLVKQLLGASTQPPVSVADQQQQFCICIPYPCVTLCLFIPLPTYLAQVCVCVLQLLRCHLFLDQFSDEPVVVCFGRQCVGVARVQGA